MATFKELTSAIKARLDAVQLAGSLTGVVILVEDACELESKINNALEQQGMLILIGQPVFENNGDSNRVASMKVSSAVAVGENPLMWRDEPLTKPVCLDVVQTVMESLQGLDVAGFQSLRVLRADFVPDKTRQLYEVAIESDTVIQRTS